MNSTERWRLIATVAIAFFVGFHVAMFLVTKVYADQKTEINAWRSQYERCIEWRRKP